jgi:hypothetical protein
MRKYLALSAVTIGLLSSSSLNAADNLESMFKDGKVSGQIRMFYVDREYQGSSGASTHRDSTAIGGHLKFVTDDFKGLKFATAFYTTNRIGLNQHDVESPTLLGNNNESYSIVGEAYVEYKISNTNLKGGRVKYNSPMMGSDDARMLPNLFEAYMITNTDIEGVTLSLAQVTRFSQGSFGRVYQADKNQANALLSSTSGYSAVNSDPVDSGKFENMGTYAVGSSSSGVTVASISYKNDNLKINLYDYYANDILNTIYGDVNYNMNLDGFKPFVAAQFIKQDDVGDSMINNAPDFTGDGSINSFYWAAKVGAKIGGFTTYIAYSETGSNSNSEKTDGGYANAIITMWGGMPAYTQAMVERHQFMAGTKATKVVGAYSFKEHGVNLSASAYYASFDMDENSAYGIERTATEPGFDIKYYPAEVKNLQLRFRGNFPRKFYEDATGSTGWSEYRLIANYNF